MAPSGYRIVAAFKKNCPGVRMTDDEEAELARLVMVATEAAYEKALRDVAPQDDRRMADAR